MCGLTRVALSTSKTAPLSKTKPSIPSATDGRLTTLGGGDASSSPSFTYGYLPNSNLIQTITPTAGAVQDVTNTYESNRNVLASKQNKVGTSILSQYDYTVNAIGQRTGVTTTGTAFPATPSWLWGYDSLGQVITADSSVNTSDRSYQYDSIGNRKKSAESLTLPTDDNYTANALNQYSSVASVNPAYDFDGNATAYPLPVAPSTNSDLTWDAENRLISSTVGTTTKTTLYDAQSRRIADKTGSSTALYIYDGFNCIAEYTGTTLSKTRLWGPDLSGSLQGAGGVGGLLAEKQGGNFYYPTYDGNGNVSEYVTSAGVVTTHFEYDPFGNTVVNTDSSNQFAYRFSTKPLDFATGLYYYGYRFYDAERGRWLNRDPIEENGGVNLYGFVNNDSINKIDLLGNALIWSMHLVYPATGKAKSNIPNLKSELERILKQIGITPDINTKEVVDKESISKALWLGVPDTYYYKDIPRGIVDGKDEADSSLERLKNIYKIPLPILYVDTCPWLVKLAGNTRDDGIIIIYDVDASTMARLTAHELFHAKTGHNHLKPLAGWEKPGFLTTEEKVISDYSNPSKEKISCEVADWIKLNGGSPDPAWVEKGWKP